MRSISRNRELCGYVACAASLIEHQDLGGSQQKNIPVKMSLFLPASIANGNISNYVPFVVNFVDLLLVTLQMCVFLRLSSPFMFKVLKTYLLF